MVDTANKPNTRYILVTAFLIPVLLLTGIYILRGIHPFGEQVFLRSDMYHQYAPFMAEFQRRLQTGGSLAYSWNAGLGNNFASIYAYYLASPTNWLVGLFPDTLIPEFLSLMIIIKSGLMSLTFSWYLMRHFNKNNFFIPAWGCFYAMSAYMAAYCYNIMWLDCLILFPLIILGLEALVKNGYFRLYTFSLALSCISNYYISIMISIFLIFYFIYLIICEEPCHHGKPLRICLLRFTVYSFISGAIAMFIILPALYNLFFTASCGSDFPSTMKAYFNPLKIITQSVINTRVSMFEGHLPNIYSTMSVFILVPMYILSRKIPRREKLGKSCLILLLIFSFMFSIPTYIWHGFHFPNSLPCRHSFIYIFMILIISYQAFLHIEEQRSVRQIYICAGGIAAIFILQAVFQDSSLTTENASLGALFTSLYALFFLVLKRKGNHKKILLAMLMVISIIEPAINTYNTGYSTTSHTAYVKNRDAVRNILKQIDDNSFYRIENLNAKTKNDGVLNNYKNTSVFSSTSSAGISALYKDLGLLGKTNSYSYKGHTPFIRSLLGVKYEISCMKLSDALMKEIAASDRYHIYKNNYVLPLGFMVNKNLMQSLPDESDPFSLQNTMIQNACAVQDVFRIQESGYGRTVQFAAQHSGRCLVFISSATDSVSAEIKHTDAPSFQKQFDNLEVPWILDLGDVKKGDRISVTNNDEDLLPITVLPAIMDYSSYKKAINVLASSPLMVTDFNDTHVAGHIEVSSDNLMFTSIPYDPGWTLYVDGQRTDYACLYDSFIVCELSEGSHVIELRYFPKGLMPGIIVSVLALICLAILSLLEKKNIHKKIIIQKGTSS